jgi:hypothetical protein
VDIINRLTNWHKAQFDENRYIIGSNFQMLEVQLSERQQDQLGPHLFSPLKKKRSQRYMRDGTPRSILSPRCRRPFTTGGKGKCYSRTKFSFTDKIDTPVRHKLSFENSNSGDDSQKDQDKDAVPISSLASLKLDSSEESSSTSSTLANKNSTTHSNSNNNKYGSEKENVRTTINANSSSMDNCKLMPLTEEEVCMYVCM